MIRKHYLESHRSGLPVQLAAVAVSQAAQTEGERVDLVGQHAVMTMGEAPLVEVERFAADVAQLLDERLVRRVA